MKIHKITCNDTNKCHDDLKLLFPNVISISHLENNHIIIESNDYDVNGHVLKSSYNLMIKSDRDSIKTIADKEFV